MARVHEWPPAVAARIADLRLPESGLPEHVPSFWGLVERTGEGELPLEVLAYLTRAAYAHGQVGAAERVFTMIWERSRRRVAQYALRRYSTYLHGEVSEEDIVVEAFRLLAARLRAAGQVTFYEVTFFGGLSKLVLDQGRSLDHTFVESLNASYDESDDAPRLDPEDHKAVNPEQHALEEERRHLLGHAVHDRLAGLSPRAAQTARLLMQSRSETAIAGVLGVSTRMIRNYKAQIRSALEDVS